MNPRRPLPPSDPLIERLGDLSWWEAADAGKISNDEARAEINRRARDARNLLTRWRGRCK